MSCRHPSENRRVFADGGLGMCFWSNHGLSRERQDNPACCKEQRIHPVLSLAGDVARCRLKRRQRYQWAVGGGQMNHLAAPRKAGLQDRSTTPRDSVGLPHYPRGGWDVTKRTLTALGAVAGVSGLKHRGL